MEDQKENESLHDNLTLMTINQLELLTGKAYKTITRKLNGVEPKKVKGTYKYYIPKDVLPIIYDLDGCKGGKYELERAKLTEFKKQKEELLVKKLKGELVNVENVKEYFGRLVSNFRAQLLVMPARLAQDCFGAKDSLEIEETIRKAVEESLEELSITDARKFSQDISRDPQDIETASEIEPE